MTESRDKQPRRPSPEQGSRPSPEQPTLPNLPDDERDVGWGDDPNSERRDEDWYRRERPPHHE